MRFQSRFGSFVLGLIIALICSAQSGNFIPVDDTMLQKPDPADWLMWRRTLDSWGYSPLNQVSRGNVAQLRMVWTRGMGTGVQEATPLVHDGILFLPNPSDLVQAINGALMTFLTAVRCHVDAAVAYHGSDTEKYLGEVDNLRAPLLMHLGEEDEFISKAAQAQIKKALAGNPHATVYSYPGQRHAFARHNGAHYNAAAAALANGRTSEFLHRHLR
jgi:pimeloyl-ACP methyl ester carboxylesterase